jgi:hypothetical protein
MDYPAGMGKHLIIVAGKEKNTENCLLVVVHVTSVGKNINEDHSCVFKPGEHPFIKKQSYVRYSQMCFAQEKYIESRILLGQISKKEPLSGDLLSRVRSGALKSKAIPLKFKKYF